MAKILILIGGHISTAPRPQKEADTLTAAGHDVLVQGAWCNPEFVRRDCSLLDSKKWRFKPFLDFQPCHKMKWWEARIRHRLAVEKFKRFQTFSPELLGYGAQEMLTAARRYKADLTIVHSEAGLWVGDELLNEGSKVGVDFEDWFSEDLLDEDRIARPLKQLRVLEGRLARDCSYSITTSHALSDALARAYQAPTPTVIYNTFPWKDRELIDNKILDRKNPNLPSLHWFSQTIGPGRGLEILFKALPHVSIPIEIHLRGDYPERSRQWLGALMTSEWRDRIFIHSTVPNAELLSRIAEHDIGLALELPDIPSRNLTVTNKLFQYLQAGLAIIATDTAGQREILSQCPEVGRLITCDEPKTLADAIQDLLVNPHKLKTAKIASLQAATKKFHWETQAELVLQQVEKALD